MSRRRPLFFLLKVKGCFCFKRQKPQPAEHQGTGGSVTHAPLPEPWGGVCCSAAVLIPASSQSSCGLVVMTTGESPPPSVELGGSSSSCSFLFSFSCSLPVSIGSLSSFSCCSPCCGCYELKTHFVLSCFVFVCLFLPDGHFLLVLSFFSWFYCKVLISKKLVTGGNYAERSRRQEVRQKWKQHRSGRREHRQELYKGSHGVHKGGPENNSHKGVRRDRGGWAG